MFTTDAIALASPSGKMSKRSLKAAQERVRRALFGNGLKPIPTPQPSLEDTYLRQAAELRLLASKGMKPRAHLKEARRLEQLAGKH